MELLTSSDYYTDTDLNRGWVQNPTHISLFLLALYRYHTSFSRGLVDAIEDHLTMGNVLDVIKRTKAYNCQAVITMCWSFITSHHCQIVKQKGAAFDSEDVMEL